MRLRAGRELRVVNASSTGLWVEGPARLLPGTHVEVHVFTTGGRVLTRTRVARACVWAISATAVLYRAALCFERPVDMGTAGDAMPGAPSGPAEQVGMAYPDDRRLAMGVAGNAPEDASLAAQGNVASRLVGGM